MDQKVTATIEAARRELRWISAEEVTELLSTRPRIADVEAVPTWSAQEGGPLCLTEDGTRRWVWAVNDEVAAAVIPQTQFFDTVESSPLTHDQARAVVTYDNRVNVIAAAGSGKTSGMVARAAYAVSRELAKPEEIVLLAFNNDAATNCRHVPSAGSRQRACPQRGRGQDLPRLRTEDHRPGHRTQADGVRSGSRGSFWGSSTFPRCRYTSNSLPPPGSGVGALIPPAKTTTQGRF